MKSGYDLFAVFSFLLSSGNVLFHTFEKERVVVIKQSIMVLPVEKRYELSLIIGILLKHQVSSSEVRGGTFLIGGWGLGRRGGSLVNFLQIGEGQICFIRNRGRVTVFFGKEKIARRLVYSYLFSRTARFRFFTNPFCCSLRLSNFKLNVTQGKVEKFLNSVSAKMQL